VKEGSELSPLKKREKKIVDVDTELGNFGMMLVGQEEDELSGDNTVVGLQARRYINSLKREDAERAVDWLEANDESLLGYVKESEGLEARVQNVVAGADPDAPKGEDKNDFFGSLIRFFHSRETNKDAHKELF
jgi:hypothetical protein